MSTLKAYTLFASAVEFPLKASFVALTNSKSEKCSAVKFLFNSLSVCVCDGYTGVAPGPLSASAGQA